MVGPLHPENTFVIEGCFEGGESNPVVLEVSLDDRFFGILMRNLVRSLAHTSIWK